MLGIRDVHYWLVVENIGNIVPAVVHVENYNLSVEMQHGLDLNSINVYVRFRGW